MERSKTINTMMLVLRVGIGAFFLLEGLLKVAVLAGWGLVLRMMGIVHVNAMEADLVRFDVLPSWADYPVAGIGLAMEIVVGACLLFRWMYRGAAWLGVLMTSVYVILLSQAWARGLELSCHCFVQEHSISDYPAEIALRLLFLSAMIVLLWDSGRNRQTPWQYKRYDFSEV